MTMSKVLLGAAALSMGVAGAALAGSQPVTPGNSTPVTSIPVTPPSTGGGGGPGSVPTFFTVSPSVTPGGTFTFVIGGPQQSAALPLPTGPSEAPVPGN